MIRIFGQTDTVFISNGDCVVSPLKAKVHKKDNSDYYLDLETDLSYLPYFIEGNIVIANTPTGDQAFRIGNVTKSKSKLVSKCFHVYYDSKNYLIADSYVVDMNCNNALNHLNDATEPTSPFTMSSDVQAIDSYRCVRSSLYEAMQTVLERWGGHLVRDNFDIEVKAAIGQDNGIIVQYKKNLKDITSQEQWDSVVTKILPVGKDGLLLNDQNPAADIYIESDTQYDLPYTKTVAFSQDDIVEEDYPTEQAYKQALVNDLRMQATKYLEANCVPLVNYTLKANLEKVTDIGDVVEVIDDRLGIHMMTSVIGFVYDCIFEQYTEVEFGNFTRDLSGLINNITVNVNQNVTEQVNNMASSLNSQLITVSNSIMGILGGSYVINDGYQCLLVDRLPKEDAVNVIRMNSTGLSFSQTGIDGTFREAWNIDSTLNMSNIPVIGLIADMVKGGTLKRGSHTNIDGSMQIYDSANVLVGTIDKDGLKMYGADGSYIVLNDANGFAVFDRAGQRIAYIEDGELHTLKSSVAKELTLGGQVVLMPMQVESGGTVVNEGIGIVGLYQGGN